METQRIRKCVGVFEFFVTHFPKPILICNKYKWKKEKLNECIYAERKWSISNAMPSPFRFGIYTRKRFAIHHIKINYSEFSAKWAETHFFHDIQDKVFSSAVFFGCSSSLLLHNTHTHTQCVRRTVLLPHLKLCEKWKFEKEFFHSLQIHTIRNTHNLTPLLQKKSASLKDFSFIKYND